MIKTTKETHKQDETFKSKVTFDSYDNVYANVNGEMKSLPDYIASKGSAPSNMMTTDTEQHITGHKYFTKLAISNESGTDNFDITTDIDNSTATNKVYFTREETSGYYRNEFVFKGGTAAESYFSLIAGDSVPYIYEYDNLGKVSNRIAFPSKSGTLTLDTSLNVISEAPVALIQNQTYKTTKDDKPYGVYNNHIIIKLINDENVYTASFDIMAHSLHKDQESRVAFLMQYGTSVSDVATCYAYINNEGNYGYLVIDLDNCTLTSGYSINVYFYKYN